MCVVIEKAICEKESFTADSLDRWCRCHQAITSLRHQLAIRLARAHIKRKRNKIKDKSAAAADLKPNWRPNFMV